MANGGYKVVYLLRVKVEVHLFFLLQKVVQDLGPKYKVKIGNKILQIRIFPEEVPIVEI